MRTEGDVGFAAVRTAAGLCESVRAEMVAYQEPNAMNKQDGSPVTIADFGAQALVCRTVAEAFPGDVIVAEEDSAILREPTSATQLNAIRRFVGAQLGTTEADAICSWIDQGKGEPRGRFWALDPIDGTKGFLRNDQYAIALALIEEGIALWGFLACPVLPYDGGSGVIFVARRGAGAQAFALNGASLGPVRVSSVMQLREARLVESVESAHTNRGVSAQLQETLGIEAASVRMDSQAKYGAVARGQADIYLRAPNPRTPDYRECIWDHAAGSVIVEEAGGRVTDIRGHGLEWQHGRRLQNNVGVVASNGRLHEVIIETLAPLLPSFPA